MSKGGEMDMERTYLRMTYEGEAVANHEIDIHTVAPALLATANLVQKASRIQYGKGVNIRLKVGALEGNCVSFDIAVELSLCEGFLNYLQGISLYDVLNNIGLISGISGISLVTLFQWLKGRKIERYNELNDKIIEIYTKDGDATTIPREVYDLLKDEIIRDLRGMMKPVSQEGIDKISFYNNKKELGFEVSKNDWVYFEDSPITEEYKEETLDLIGVLDRPSLLGNKTGWKLTINNKSQSIIIEDEAFLDRVKNGDVFFNKNTLFNVKMRMEQSIVSGEAKIKQYAISVTEYHPPEHPLLPFDE